jgi:DNA-binding transcriptional LysR family regulator
MLPKGVTLRGLEVLAALAERGSVAQAAEATGLSQPSVSQQLGNLEKALGLDLVDRTRRPLRLTPAGRAFYARAEVALRELRQAASALTVMDLGHVTTLSMGLIDDFDNDLTPQLASILADSLTRSRFKLVTAPSHEISDALENGALHIAVAANTGKVLAGVTEFPLLRDPFVLAVPRSMRWQSGDGVDELAQEPLIRYAAEQLISRQIEAQLARHGLSAEARFEIGSHLALMAMVARGTGWAVTTALGYMRAVRYHDQIALHPLPFGDAARTISLFAGDDWAETIPRDLTKTMRRLLQELMIAPAHATEPWLQDSLHLLDG